MLSGSPDRRSVRSATRCALSMAASLVGLATLCGCGIAGGTSTAAPGTPSLVLESSVSCARQTARDCRTPTRFTILVTNLQGFSAPESVQVSLALERGRSRGRSMPEPRIGRFRALGPERIGAAFDSLRPGAYLVRIGPPTRSASVWRVGLVRGCWSRLEIWTDARAAPDALSPSAATLYSCPGPTF